MTEISDLAARLAKAVADRTAIAPLSDDVPGLDAATAYMVQAMAREQADSLAGWKLGVTSRAKQAQIGVHEPIRGFLASADALDLSGPSATAADVLAATSHVAAGIEILDSRFLDYRFTMPDVIADNTSAGRFIVGAPVPVDGIDLRLAGVVLELNGEVVGTASGAAALGHPAAAVAWLVRSLAAEGEGLRAGQVILSGGLTAAVPVRPGNVVVVSIDRIGTIELGCQ